MCKPANRILIKFMEPERPRKKILLVEDQREYSLMVKVLLSEGYEVVTVSNGLEALSRLDSNYRPDVIISDFRMPVLDGFRFIHLLQQHHSLSGIPVIILTGIDSSQLDTGLLGDNVLVILHKPDDAVHLLEELVPAIESASGALF